LNAAESFSKDAIAFEMEAKVIEFINSNTGPKSLLIMGNSGSGKSLFTRVNK